jgi:hypothetical protein
MLPLHKNSSLMLPVVIQTFLAISCFEYVSFNISQSKHDQDPQHTYTISIVCGCNMESQKRSPIQIKNVWRHVILVNPSICIQNIQFFVLLLNPQNKFQISVVLCLQFLRSDNFVWLNLIQYIWNLLLILLSISFL